MTFDFNTPNYRCILSGCGTGRKSSLDCVSAFLIVSLVLVLTGCNFNRTDERPPYPHSTTLVGITFDFKTRISMAPGSDNWPTTWADDGYQYVVWGDGGGFGGTNLDSRVSLGVARVEGNPPTYSGHNVFGGKNSESRAYFGGKSYGIICIHGCLYMWVSPGSNAQGYQRQTLYRSFDHGHTWEKASWSFHKADRLVNPTFVQFGRNYELSPDEYVYIYAVRLQDDSRLKIQKPGQIDLFRVQKDRLMDRRAYEIFCGLKNQSEPKWCRDIHSRKPVFEDPNGVGWCVSAIYNKPLNRYLISTEHAQSFEGKLGLFEALTPWGPWSTVAYLDSFGSPYVKPTTFFWNFSPKWFNSDGAEFVMIFTGIRENDSWNTISGSFIKNYSVRK